MPATKKPSESGDSSTQGAPAASSEEVDKLLNLFQQLIDHGLDRARKTDQARGTATDDARAADSLLGFRMIRSLLGSADPEVAIEDPFPEFLAGARWSRNKLRLTEPNQGEFPREAKVEIRSNGGSPAVFELGADKTVTLPPDYKGPITSVIVRGPDNLVHAVAGGPLHKQ